MGSGAEGARRGQLCRGTRAGKAGTGHSVCTTVTGTSGSQYNRRAAARLQGSKREGLAWGEDHSVNTPVSTMRVRMGPEWTGGRKEKRWFCVFVCLRILGAEGT